MKPAIRGYKMTSKSNSVTQSNGLRSIFTFFSNLGFVSHEWSLFIIDIVLNKVFVPGETISPFYCSFRYLCNSFKMHIQIPF